MSAATVAKLAEQILRVRLDEREEQKQIAQILARIPADERSDYEGLSLAQVKRVARRFHAHVLTGAVPSMPAAEREALDAKMGMPSAGGWLAQEEGSKFVFNPHATPEDATRALATLDAAERDAAKQIRATSRSSTAPQSGARAQALANVLAKKGAI